MRANIKTYEWIKAILRQFDSLKKNQRILVLLLLAAILFNVYYNLIYKNQSQALRSAKSEQSVVNNSLARLKSQMPDMNKEKDRLALSKRTFNTLRERLRTLESELPTQESVPQLLGELVRQAAGYSIDFISIRPKTGKGRQEYSELVIEMKLSSSYTDLANYLNRLESISRFIRADNIVMENMKDGFRSNVDSTIALSTLLGEPGIGKKEVVSVPAEPLAIERNPFASIFRPILEAGKKEEYSLSGIITTGAQPTAIINNEVYRIGDRVDSRAIIKILPGMVVLSDGRDNKILYLEKQ